MSEAKKFLLVDQSNIERIRDLLSSNKRLEPLPKREVYQLDKEMLKIIEDPFLSEPDKVKKYNAVLTGFQTVLDKVNESSNAIKRSTDQPKAIPRVKTSDYNPILGVSKPYKNKAKDLMELLNNSDLRINDNGEVNIGDYPLSGSNISDLLNKTVNPSAKNQSVPGWESFRTYISSLNIPQALLSPAVRQSVQKLIKKPKTKQDYSPSHTYKAQKQKTKKLSWSPY